MHDDVKPNDPREWTKNWAGGSCFTGFASYPHDGRETLWEPYERLVPTQTVGEFLDAYFMAMGAPGARYYHEVPDDILSYLSQRVMALPLDAPSEAKIDRFGRVTKRSEQGIMKAKGSPLIIRKKDSSGHEHGADGKFVGAGGVTTSAKRLRTHEPGFFSGGQACGKQEGEHGKCSNRRTITMMHEQDGHVFRDARCDHHALMVAAYAVRHGHMDPKHMGDVFGEHEVPKTIAQERAQKETPA